MVDSVELGVNVAAQSLLSLSLQIRNQQRIDEMLRKLLSDVTMMLGTMSMFIAPIVLAVVGALQRMVIGAMTSSCSSQNAAAGTASTSSSSLGSMSAISFCPTGGKSISSISADPATFMLMIGFTESRLVYESDITLFFVSFFDPLDLSETLVGTFSRFSFKKLSGDEFIHNTLEVKFFLCHTKIFGHRNIMGSYESKSYFS